MPTTEDLEHRIDERFEQLTLLLTLTTQQETAIAGGHMNELMRILSEKQRLLETFVRTSEQLKSDREKFTHKPDLSDPHRSRHEQCDTMHQELMRREAASQSKLEQSRDEIAIELTRGEGAKRAASGYGQANRPAGGGLDLSSEG